MATLSSASSSEPGVVIETSSATLRRALSSERFALQRAEEERSLERARRSVAEDVSITTPGSLDDALLRAAMDLTER